MLIVLGRGAHPSCAGPKHPRSTRRYTFFFFLNHQDGEGDSAKNSDGLVLVSHSIPILSPLFPIGVKWSLSGFLLPTVSMYFSTQDGNQRWENPGFFNRKMMHHRVKKSWFSSGHPAPGNFPNLAGCHWHELRCFGRWQELRWCCSDTAW